MIQQKKSQVLFVLTGDCGNQTISEGISVYELIAAASTGQVFQLKKKDVNQMLKFVEESVQANRVNLISTDNGEAANKTYICLLYTSPSPRDRTRSRMPSSA